MINHRDWYIAATYEDLLKRLQQMSPEQLKCNTTVMIDGEFIAVKTLCAAHGNCVLDDDHPYLATWE